MGSYPLQYWQKHPQVEHRDGLPGAQNYLVAHLGGLVQKFWPVQAHTVDVCGTVQRVSKTIHFASLRSRCEFPSCNGWQCSWVAVARGTWSEGWNVPISRPLRWSVFSYVERHRVASDSWRTHGIAALWFAVDPLKRPFHLFVISFSIIWKTRTPWTNHYLAEMCISSMQDSPSNTKHVISPLTW